MSWQRYPDFPRGGRPGAGSTGQKASVRLFTALSALLLGIAVPAPAVAQPHVIADLSEGALLGPIASTTQLQADFRANQALISRAGDRLGLTSADMVKVRSAIARGNVRYVIMPHHLDGMAGAYAGHAFAVHDAVVPAKVYAWEVDVEEPDAVVQVFVPNKCGNISYIRSPRRIVALRYTYVAPHSAAKPDDLAAYAPPAPAFALQSTSAAPAAPAPRVSLASVSISSNTVAPRHHFAILPWLALGLIGIALSEHGHGSGIGGFPAAASAPRPVPAPAPTPAPVKGCG